MPLSLLFGDVFRAFNPWRAVGRSIAWVATQASRGPLPAPLAYPERLGRWPAVVGIVAFGWLELVSANGDTAETVAIATLIYSAVTWVGMALYGVDALDDRGEAFSVYFNLFSRMSVFERRDGEVGVCAGRSRVCRSWEPAPGSVAFVCALIGIVSFDGFSGGPTLERLDRRACGGLRVGRLRRGARARADLRSLGAGRDRPDRRLLPARRAGATRVGGGFTARELASQFAHSLAPIALVYAAAHYVSFLLFQGQDIIRLVSDPLGEGSDYLRHRRPRDRLHASSVRPPSGTSRSPFVVAGHVGALILAHDRAIAIYDDAKRRSARSTGCSA